MKKIFLFCLTFILVIFAGVTTVDAQENTVVKVGYLKNYGIVNEPIIQGSVGYGFDYLSEIEKYTDYEFEYISTDWATGLKMLEKGEIDLFGLASITEERSAVYDFVHDPICYETATLYASKDSEIYADAPTQLDGLTVGIPKGVTYRNVIEQYTELYNIKVNIKEMGSEDFVPAIENGEIDVFMSGSLFQYKDMKIIGELFAEPVYLMTTKGNTQLCHNIAQAISEIEARTPYFDEDLWEKYYGHNRIESHSITELERMVLDEKDVYTVGYHVDLEPISYINEDGQPDGYSVDVMNMIAQKIDIEISYVPLHDENNNSEETLDFNLCVIADKDYMHRYISAPYYYHELVTLRKQGLNPEDVKHLSALDYSTIHIDDHLEAYSSAQIHKSYSVTQSNELEKQVDVDAYAALDGRAELILNDKGSQAYSVDFVGEKIPLAITISHDIPLEVCTALDKAIMSFDESTVEELITATVADLQPKLGFVDFLIRYSHYILAMAFVLICIYVYLIRENRNRLRNLLEVDQLTGLMSYAKLKEKAEKLLKTATPNEYCFISFDVDNFKYINQIYGVEKGNAVLCKIADFMRRYSHKDSLLCRHQNDVFVVFGKVDCISGMDLKKLTVASAHIQEIVTTLELQIPIYFSVGIYYIKDPTAPIDNISDDVRKTRQISKSTHGNKITVYSEKIQKELERRKIIYTSMEKAIENKEFFIVIQPKIELKTGKLVGGEVLVRWKKQDGSFVYPDEFIPLFEKNEFITHLDKYVFEEACKFVKNAKADIPLISVNISAVTAKQENFLDTYLDILNRYELQPKQFELELTESALSEDFEIILLTITKAKQAGFHFSIDDFGKGASSLTRIKDLNVDVLKLDREFVPDCINDNRSILVVENIISMAQDLGFTTLAEGIEFQKDLDLLLELGCEIGQGYFFDRPLSTDDFLGKVIEDAKNNRTS